MRIDINGAIVRDNEAWVYDWFGIPNTSPRSVKNKLSAAAGSDVDVYISSDGGDVWSGSEIYSELRAYRGNVRLHITGLAASAASVIACAGKSDISPTASIMVHNASVGSVSGDYHVMDKTSDTLKKVNQTIAAAYVEKSGMTEQQALELMDNETWLTAEEAVRYGLVDEISKGGERLVASAATLLPQAVIDKITAMMEEETGRKNASAKLKLLKLKGGI